MKILEIGRLLQHSNPSKMKEDIPSILSLPNDTDRDLTVEEMAQIASYYKNSTRAGDNLKNKAAALLFFLDANPNPTDNEIRTIMNGLGNETNEEEPQTEPLAPTPNDDEPKVEPVIEQPNQSNQERKSFDWMLIPIAMVLLLVILIQAFYFAVVEHHYSKDSFIDLEWLTLSQRLSLAYLVGLAFELTALLLAFNSRKEEITVTQGYGSNRKEVKKKRLDGTFWWLLIFSIFGAGINCIFYAMDGMFSFPEFMLSLAKPGSIFAFGHLFAKKIQK